MDHDLVIDGAEPAGISTALEAREAGIASGCILALEKGPARSCAICKYYRASLNHPLPPPKT